MERSAEVVRNTRETKIHITLLLEGKGMAVVNTGCGFLDHMLELFASHGRFDLAVSCEGDTHVDDHHTVEDIGIALGQAFCEALGEKRGIRRYGYMILPMDEALILTAVDLSGRDVLNFDMELPAAKVGTFDTELVEEFFLGFVRQAKCALHIKALAGKNTHHMIEGTFKSCARSLREAVSIDPELGDAIPSTKGIL